ncbi:MAG: insulinase family protein [Alistipes sp.]
MKKLLILVVAAFAMTSAVAQINPMTPIPADKDVRVGKLENGMTYYIRHNEKPKGQADFYILHDVGAIQEDDTQQGLAHFLEHMAFNGTKNLPDKMLTEYLEKVGVKFGANLNANTSWDRTMYLIKDVPTIREGIVDSALLILHDWSHFIALKSEEIDSERGVIMEELRTTDGANWRSTQELIKSLGKGSKYETRNLIGYLDGLKSFPADRLRAFYEQWYRPDYQAIVIVGDLNVDAVEAKIKSLMKDIPAPKTDASQKETITVADNAEPIVNIFADKEMQGSLIKLFIKRPAMPNQANNLIYREMIDLMLNYISTMGNARLEEIAMKPNAPFLGGFISTQNMGIIPSMDTFAFLAQTQDGKLAPGFEAIYAEMEKIRRYGFTQSEFERAQNDMMRQAERSYANRNDRRNGEYIQTYISNYQKNTAMPDAQTEWQLDSMLIKNIDVNTINALAQKLVTPENQVIVITAPAKEGIVNPTAAELLALRDKVTKSELAAYADTSVKEPLIAEGTVLNGSPVKTTTTNAVFGTTEWTLKNGVKIIVKPTTFKADEVRLNVTTKGGSSILSDEDYYSGQLMSAINSMSGVSKFSATDLKKQLSGKSAMVGTSVDEYTHNMSGYCSPKDMETMLQLLYLNFTAPRFDQNDFNALIKMVRAQIDNVKSNPDYIAEERKQEVIYNKNFRRQMLSPEILDGIKFENLPAIYNKLYPGAQGFTFTFVGNVDLATLKPLVEKYIGSIPAKAKALTFVDDKVAPVKGKVIDEFKAVMQQPKVKVSYYFSGDKPYTLENKLAVTFLSQTLSSRYLISIREEKGGTYGVGVQGSTDYMPKQTYDLAISFDTNEAMADELCEIIMKEIQQIADNGPKSEDIEKIREYLAKSWKNSLEQNGSWLGYINNQTLYNLDFISNYERALTALTGADVQALAKQMLSDGNMVKVVMRPEVAAAPAEKAK